jgi:transketolase N-terminal domain/subunit
MAAVQFKATNLISFVDRNKCMIDGRTEDVMTLSLSVTNGLHSAS